VKLSKASVGYRGSGGVEAPLPLLEGVDLSIPRGARIVLLGPNGVGKSTALKAVSGALPLLAGSREVGQGVDMGVFTQDLAQDLPQDRVALEYVLETVRQKDMSITDQRARAALGSLGLSGEKALRPIGALSGGEKARVALAVFVLVPHNFLVMDGGWVTFERMLSSRRADDSFAALR
jgi:ATPase subunit of ABC transporter with duplicated ATPase domains